MISWDRVGALLLLVFAVYTIVAAPQMGYMQDRIPGPGFAPFWIGVGLALAAVVILAGTHGGRSESTESTAAATQASTLIAIAAITVAAVALTAPLGMLAAICLMLLALARILGATWRTAVLTATGLPLALYVIFALWLKVPLPRGPWGF